MVAQLARLFDRLIWRCDRSPAPRRSPSAFSDKKRRGRGNTWGGKTQPAKVVEYRDDFGLLRLAVA